MIELIGYAASVLVAVSLLTSNVLRLRVLNLAGAAVFVVYAALAQAWPVLAVNLFVAVVTFAYFCYLGLVRKKAVVSLLIVLTFASLVLGYVKNRDWNVALEQRLYDDKVIGSFVTRYQHLAMTFRPETDDYRLYINGNLQFSSVDEAIYLADKIVIMSARPGRIKDIIDIDLPRPRNRTSPDVNLIRDRILSMASHATLADPYGGMADWQPLLEQVGLVDVLQGVRFLAHRGGAVEAARHGLLQLQPDPARQPHDAGLRGGNHRREN